MELKDIMAGESGNVEFKEMLPAKSIRYMKTVVAFANGHGGHLCFGIRDADRAVVGIAPQDIFRTMDAITTAIADSCEPAIYPDIFKLSLEGQQVIVVDVPAGRQRPYYIKSQGMLDGVYVRINGTTRQADRSYVQELILEDSNRYFDQLPVDYEVTEQEAQELCDSLHDFATRHRRRGQRAKVREIAPNTLLSWGVLAEKAGKLVPTNAYSLLTGRQGELLAKVQCGVFRGNNRALLVNRQEFTGPVQQQAQEVYEYLLSKIDLRTQITGLYREDSYEFPPESLREAVVNAIVHRSYLERRNITVFLYDDRLEITSPGGLLRGVTIERMKEGFSKIRNRALTSAFVYMNLIDEYGSGIPRILQEFQAAHLFAPKFVNDEVDFKLVFQRQPRPFSVHEVPATFDRATDDTEDDTKTRLDTNAVIQKRQVVDTDDTKVDTKNDTNELIQKRVCAALRENPRATQSELAQQLGVSRATIARLFERMKSAGLLQRVGSRRGGHWLVRDSGNETRYSRRKGDL